MFLVLLLFYRPSETTQLVGTKKYWLKIHSAICCLWQVPPRAEEITIPADVTPEKVPTHIVDYSGKMTWRLKYTIQSTSWCQMSFIVKLLMNYQWSWRLSPYIPTEQEQSDEVLRDEIVKVKLARRTKRTVYHFCKSWKWQEIRSGVYCSSRCYICQILYTFESYEGF